MIKRSWLPLVFFTAAPAGALLSATGCSSTSSSGATPGEAGAGVSAEAGLAEGGGDGGDAGTVSLTWKTIVYSAARFATPLPGDGGPDGSANSDAGADKASVEDAGDGGDGGDGGPTVVPGVQICAFPQPSPIPAPGAASGNCATTDANGEFVLTGLPVRTTVALTVNKAGFTPGLLSMQTASTPMDSRNNPITMFPTSFETDPPPPLTVDWQNKGQIYTFVLALGGKGFHGQPGATVSMTPMTGNGPLYLDTTESYAPDAQAFIDNSAQFYNVGAGTYTLTFVDPSDPTVDCEPIVGFAGFGIPVTMPAHSLQVLVAPGYISGLVGALCTTKPPIVAVDGG